MAALVVVYAYVGKAGGAGTGNQVLKNQSAPTTEAEFLAMQNALRRSVNEPGLVVTNWMILPNDP